MAWAIYPLPNWAAKRPWHMPKLRPWTGLPAKASSASSAPCPRGFPLAAMWPTSPCSGISRMSVTAAAPPWKRLALAFPWRPMKLPFAAIWLPCVSKQIGCTWRITAAAISPARRQGFSSRESRRLPAPTGCIFIPESATGICLCTPARWGRWSPCRPMIIPAAR